MGNMHPRVMTEVCVRWCDSEGGGLDACVRLLYGRKRCGCRFSRGASEGVRVVLYGWDVCVGVQGAFASNITYLQTKHNWPSGCPSASG